MNVKTSIISTQLKDMLVLKESLKYNIIYYEGSRNCKIYYLNITSSIMYLQ